MHGHVLIFLKEDMEKGRGHSVYRNTLLAKYFIFLHFTVPGYDTM